MVLGHASRALPGVVVPDELALTVWGRDPRTHHLDVTTVCGAARALMVAEPLPVPLCAALRELEPALLVGTTRHTVTLSGPEVPAGAWRAIHRTGGAEAGYRRGAGELRDEHGHGDMMAITGEPSEDGLVMEPMTFSYGPLLTPLPGGVVLGLELDGDVVSRCGAHATLHVTQCPGDALVPDVLAPAAWTTVLELAAESQAEVVPTDAIRCGRVAAVELERAVSHLAWLRCFARLLGWIRLVRRVQPALNALARARAAVPAATEPLAIAAARADQIVALLRRNRAWSARTRGRGLLGADTSAGLHGPNLRAAGLSRDARSRDRLYAHLGFEPILERSGDARARTLVRAREAAQSIRLADAALRAAVSSSALPRGTGETWPGLIAVLEGPRGPLTARATDHGLAFAAPGERAAIVAAGRVAVGHEWAAALVGITSLDLSPWRVGTWG